MCYRPLKFVNPTRTLCECSKVRISVPCGDCAECHSQKVSDAHVRSHMEMLDCLDANGFLWYDTLTYSDAYLPHISDFIDLPIGQSDFSCFDNKHLTDALKRLRKAFHAKIRYMIVPEYGNDNRFTHRPHYHCIFFVYSSVSTAVDFGVALSKAWHYGFTDFSNPAGKYYRDLSHFIISNQLNASKATAYLSKYCSKIYSFLTTIKERLNFVKEIDSSVYRKVLPRRRFSVGFGLSALIRFAEPIMSDDSFSYYDGERVVAVHLNSYYVRHLYKVLCTDSLGHKVWRYKDCQSAYDFLLRKCDFQVDKSVEDYKYIIDNILPYGVQSDLFKRLGSRTLRDLAVYDNFFRDRLYFDVPNEFAVTDFVDSSLNDKAFVHHVPKDELGFCECYLLCQYPCSYDDAVHRFIFSDSLHSDNSVVSLSLRDLPILDDKVFPEWRHFDYILKTLEYFKKDFGVQFDASERLVSNFKNHLKHGKSS